MLRCHLMATFSICSNKFALVPRIWWYLLFACGFSFPRKKTASILSRPIASSLNIKRDTQWPTALSRKEKYIQHHIVLSNHATIPFLIDSCFAKFSYWLYMHIWWLNKLACYGITQQYTGNLSIYDW